MKKSLFIIMGTAAATLLIGCPTMAATFAPVGPNPSGFQAATANGELQVFSALSGRSEGNNPTWYQHSDYYLCNSGGKRLEHVDNNTGYYAQSPSVITLPPGKYMVEARAKDMLRAEVPVIIKPGQTTRVHLDGTWQPVAGTPATKLVEAPGGYPIGWHVD